ncbi:Transcriptional regulator, TrmB [Hyella patelloides LEGE 07179]|uniref:Transcriptional regulator, TrmB n=1 Tax=Hyella patelloides LEGE 07179 TaxID=945734 RepID=A0A563W1R7_9CYAN|nr:iron-sulfur cluster biosynthesis transcriptional regulator SufR [Hyella patelloides]VEP17606.1 Transcriptional regulator, TrmB [Hyella patelloides LEGE 07179]
MITTGLPSTKQNILQELLKQGQATASKLAQSLNISSQAIRRHLNELETEALIEHEALQNGMGRPQHFYRLSGQGRSLFPHSYGEFAISFLDTLAETVGKERVSKVLAKQWQRKAEVYRDRLGSGTLIERVSKLVQLRQEEGYMAELHQNQSQESKPEFVFTEYNCAISEVAESYPSVCGHELEMFSAILPDCTVERTHWINEGEHRCGYLIKAN